MSRSGGSRSTVEVTAEGHFVPTGKLRGALPHARPQIHLDTVASLEFISKGREE